MPGELTQVAKQHGILVRHCIDAWRSLGQAALTERSDCPGLVQSSDTVRGADKSIGVI